MERYLAPTLRSILQRANLPELEEIRIRLHRPFMVKVRSGFQTLSIQGQPVVPNAAYIVSRDDLERTVQLITQNSWYAWEQEIQNGYITLPGGHRVGLGGQAVYGEGRLKTIKYIASLNFRHAREVRGAANSIIGKVVLGTREVLSTLIVSPPGCGKTTLLRDLARQVANLGYQVVIIDERSELASSYQGVPQLDVGSQTDVLDGYSKELGVHHALRALGPEVIITDEIGHEHDAWILSELARTGVKVMATCHGASFEQIKKRSWARESLGVFELVIILSRRLGPGTIESVLRLDGPS